MARLDTMGFENGSAVAAGCPKILYELGLMHATGRDGKEDLVSAHKWFNIAAFKGNDTAKALREEIAMEMTRDQIAKAQRAAREWLRAN